jgi:hypothetical protein
MDTNLERPASIGVYRKRTTRLGMTVLALAGIGLVVSVFRALTVKYDVGTGSGFQTTLLIHDALVASSKVGLLVLGICLIRRHRRIRAIAGLCFALSLADSMYYIVAVVPSMRANLAPALARAIDVGAGIVLVVPALMYVGILIYLCRPGSRQEFQGSAA